MPITIAFASPGLEMLHSIGAQRMNLCLAVPDNPCNLSANFRQTKSGMSRRASSRRAMPRPSIGRDSGPTAAPLTSVIAPTPAPRNSNAASSSRNTTRQFIAPAHCPPPRPACCSTVGRASFISRCTGGTARISRRGIDSRCLKTVCRSISVFSPSPRQRRRGRDIAERAGRK